MNGDVAMDLAGKAATPGGMKKILGVILIELYPYFLIEGIAFDPAFPPFGGWRLCPS
ncbi:MAG: hypothetical protein NTY37_03940 [Methanothrix sp.]|nr:hypothetical protein [Methanothrix sp.]